jgi:diadenosine tetraphosphate (Ap4A) HIT family hydrolase
MTTAIHARVERLRAGADPTLIAKLGGGWAVFGEQQFLRGYCLLLPDPVVPQLNALAPAARAAFLGDMARLGDALLATTNTVRVNYAIFGNQDPALHAHVVPRYQDEPLPQRTAHPWTYDWTQAGAFDARSMSVLRTQLRAALGVS